MTAFVHQTDLFHPHGDPDDHWDLATVYALAMQGHLDLRGILLDYPPSHRAGDPATLAVAQLGCLTGITGVPCSIGTRSPMRHRKDTRRDMDFTNRSSAEWLCRMLQESQVPLVINIVGSCTDVAIAGLMQPDLFKSKCKAVYLNAGAAYPGKAGELEYNVKLNPNSYAAIFDLACPIYWCPCWHQTAVHQVGPYGTWYSFVQGDVMRQLGAELCNYFIYMLSRSTEPKYLRYLTAPVDPALMTEFGQWSRNMWSTAGILHAAGMGIDARRGLLPASQVTDPIFEFVPITITCADDGQTTWQLADKHAGRYIIHLRHEELYAAAMAAALGKLLSGIGRAGIK